MPEWRFPFGWNPDFLSPDRWWKIARNIHTADTSLIILWLFEPPVRTWEPPFRRRRAKYSGNSDDYSGTCDTSVRSFGNCCSRKQETMIPAVGNRNITAKNGYPVLTLFGDLFPALTTTQLSSRDERDQHAWGWKIGDYIIAAFHAV